MRASPWAEVEEIIENLSGGLAALKLQWNDDA